MAKSRTESSVVKVQPELAFLVPYAEQDTSMECLESIQVLSRALIVQRQSPDEFKKKFGEASVVILPGDGRLVVEGDGSFLFCPHFAWVEYCKWSDRKDQDSPNVLERTFDPSSQIALRAEDPDKRFEVYEGHEGRAPGKEWKYRYVKHLRFAGVVLGGDFDGTPVSISFEKGEYRNGEAFAQAIKMRKMQVPQGDGFRRISQPLWSQVWELRPGVRNPAPDRFWYGFDFNIPETGSTIDASDADAFRASHMALAEAHAKRLLRVHEDTPDEEVEQADGPDM